ncbi:diguanylate cyclase/phosphodiesterase with PAS/PAC sensor(s) [Magnetococcus marinus MC-1]|uniref:Diguanylate cyclase/phosphodiesterase with PAS/PAC sensor(S) n=1 Tax=Magnetococcus marinus (strain ATCC BAA-1437 / JCM 17883 / MC-1) TaxID=156889 RepID=A0L9T5_MAGMM|nr:EAL domain-containing protein [Magnetococcus marinus]ABK44728.1 diguanylate cyclase/phosphodiesterase with PAS/PAC sensor(s) [Magnetococcus marinus MC-1]
MIVQQRGKWMQLSIARKVVYGFAVLIVLALFSGLMVSSQLVVLQDRVARLQGQRVPLVVNAVAFVSHVKDALSALQSWMTTELPRFKQERQHAWQQARRQLLKLEQILVTDPRLLEQLEPLKEGLTQLGVLQDRIEALIEKPANKPAHQLYKEQLLPILESLDVQVRRLVLRENHRPVFAGGVAEAINSRTQLKELADLRSALSLCRSQLERILTEPDDALVQRFGQGLKQADGALAVLVRADMSQTQRQELGQVQELWSEWPALAEQVIVLRQSDHWNLARHLTGDALLPLWQTLRQRLDTTVEQQLTTMVEEGRYLEQSIALSRQVLFFSFVLLLVAGGLWAWWISHRLRSGFHTLLQRMSYVSDRIQQADLTGNWSDCDLDICLIPNHQQDEIGAAVSAYNQLLTNLVVAQGNESRFIDSLTRMHAITVRTEWDSQRKIQEILEMGGEILEMESAIVTHVDGQMCQVEHLLGQDSLFEMGQIQPLEQSFCKQVIDAGHAEAIYRIKGSLLEEHPVHTQFGVESFIGTPLYLGDRFYGALSYYSKVPRTKGFSFHDRSLISLLAQWVGWEKYRAQQLKQLEQIHQDLENAQSVAKIGSWHWDMQKDNLHWSKELVRLLGLEGDTSHASYSTYLELIHPDDRAKINRQMAAVTRGMQDRFEADHRIICHKSGELLHIHALGIVSRDSRGVPSQMVGTLQDVTRRKMAEEGLVLAKMIFDNAGEAIVITDAQGDITDVNPAYQRIMGYTRDEIVGQNPSILKSGRHDEQFYEQMWNEMLSEGHWQGEIWDRRKSGEIFPKWLTIDAIRDEQGVISNFVGLFMDITQQKETEEQLEKLAYYDPLTELPNRALFRDRLEQEMRLSARGGKSLGLFFIDLDRFKYVNDSLGHDKGDDLLIQVAGRIKHHLRTSDTVARLGGDEFTVILPGIEQTNDVARIAGAIVKSLGEVFVLQGHEVFIGGSIGIAMHPDDGEDYETLTKHADTAMYRAKEEGRGTYKFFTSDMNEINGRRLSLERALRQAVECNQLTLHYQPKVDVKQCRITGMEALVRWNHPEQGLVSPVDFIPIAEETGLIITIGEWVMQQACMDAKRLARSSRHPLQVAINLSAKQFQDALLVAKLERSLQQSGLAPELLEVEITESLAMGDVNRTIEQIGELRALGVKVSIDDFGTGYSSLSYLKKLPLNALKIDKSFIQDLYLDSDDTAIVSSILSMASALGLSVVAEGVENQAQIHFLCEKECPTIQGYFFSKPLPFEAFEKFLLDWDPVKMKHSLEKI